MRAKYCYYCGRKIGEHEFSGEVAISRSEKIRFHLSCYEMNHKYHEEGVAEYGKENSTPEKR